LIDLHAHILPGLDDGPMDLQAASRLASAAVARGTTVMAASSHINRSFSLGPADLEPAREQVVERLAQDGIPLQVIQGGEIAASRVDTLSDDELSRLALGGSRWLLLECPLSPQAPPLEPTVDELRRRGFEILLAHPERSPAFIRSPEPLQRMVATGVIAQVTATAFSGEFGTIVRRAAFAMLDRGLIHVIASDAHDAFERHPSLPIALGELEARYANARELFDWLTYSVPEAVVADRELPPRPALAPVKGGFLRRFRAG
jgi:protein-tyrosine phosphatase